MADGECSEGAFRRSAVDSLVAECGAGGAWKAYKCLRQVINWAIRKWALFVANSNRWHREAPYGEEEDEGSLAEELEEDHTRLCRA